MAVTAFGYSRMKNHNWLKSCTLRIMKAVPTLVPSLLTHDPSPQQHPCLAVLSVHSPTPTTSAQQPPSRSQPYRNALHNSQTPVAGAIWICCRLYNMSSTPCYLRPSIHPPHPQKASTLDHSLDLLHLNITPLTTTFLSSTSVASLLPSATL